MTPIKTSGAKNDCLFNAVNETLEALGYEPVSRTEIMDYMIDHLDMDLDVGTETLTFRRWFELRRAALRTGGRLGGSL